MFDRFAEMFQNVTLSGILIIMGIVFAIITVAVLIAKSRIKKSHNKPPVKSLRVRNAENAMKQINKLSDSQNNDKWAGAPLYVSDKDKKISKGEAPAENNDENELETGEFPAYIMRRDGSFDYDIIPNPLGDVFTAEPSMPKSGACYFVREKESGGYEAYDPRTAPLASDLTPVTAWFATHWDIVRQVFAVPTPWYKSISLWIAAIAGIFAFIVVMATVGG